MRFTPEQTRAVIFRDLERCALLDVSPVCEKRATVANHRSNDGHGGRPGPASLANAVALCGPCNGAIESDPELAEVARARGVKLSRGQDPDAVPFYAPTFGWVQPHDSHADIVGNIPGVTTLAQLGAYLHALGDHVAGGGE